ncbi:MAG: adenine deaminase [Mariniblastus sp.]
MGSKKGTRLNQPDRFSLTHNLVDVANHSIFPARVSVRDGVIEEIQRVEKASNFLLPGFVDAHIHVESSMLLPSEFARVAVRHGTVATVSDPHEIANVCGLDGVELMLRNASQTNFKFCFGAPACVPATTFETAGATLNTHDVANLLADPRIGYLSEMMDFPGVLNGSPEIIAKIKSAQANGKPVDGHAPGLRGDDAVRYFGAGISTDHECFTKAEALDKLAAGCKIAIREGSAARNFDALESLIDEFPDRIMLCSDDKHPDEFLLGHIDQLVARAVAAGRDVMNVLRAACLNPVEHYALNVGQLRVGDPADFIVVDNLVDFRVAQTYLDGTLAAEHGRCLMPTTSTETLNHFVATPITPAQLTVPVRGNKIRVIEAIEGQLITRCQIRDCIALEGQAVADVETDLLKIVVVNRYQPAPPAIAFVTGFGLRSGAIASSVAHDSHNVVAVGTTDESLAAAINAVIESNGGLAVTDDGSTQVLPLPVAGLMSTESGDSVGRKYSELDARIKSLGTPLRSPLMTLSFMPLLVIPSLKLSDQGLFDVDEFGFVSLFVD